MTAQTANYRAFRECLLIDSIFSWTSLVWRCNLSQLFKASPLFVLLTFLGVDDANAYTTYLGVDGVYARVFNSNPEERCLDCHHSALASGAPRGFAPDGVDYNTYANSISGSNEINAVARVTAGTMPPAGSLTNDTCGARNCSTLMSAWQSGGYRESAAPQVTTNAATAISKTGATLSASVEENGLSTSLVFQYGDVSVTENTTSSTALGSGGSGLLDTRIRVIGGLNCQTSYVFRGRATNSTGTVNGSTLGFSTSNCSPPNISGVDGTTNYVEGTTPGVIIDSTISVTHPDSSSVNCNQAIVQLTTSYESAEDLLEYTGSVAGISAGVFNSVNGSITLSGTTSCTSYATALENVRYRNTSANPDTSNRTVTMQVRDTFSRTDIDSKLISVQAVSTPPTINGVNNNGPTYEEDANPGIIIAGRISITDPDSTNCNEATVDLSTNYQSAEDILEYTGSVAGITAGTFNSTTGTLTLSGPAPCGDFATALENVRYRNTSNSPDTNTRGVNFQVLDSGNIASTVVPTTVSITALNDTPEASDDSLFVPANSSNNELDVLANDSDPDVVDTLTIFSIGTPDNGGIVSIGAPCTANTLCYAPPPNFTGTETFIYTVQDVAGATDTATVFVSPPDSDGDGNVDLIDTCPEVSNPGQEDEDGDGVGDACDLDVDGDGTMDGYIEFSVDQGRSAGSHVLQSGGAVTVAVSLTIAADINDINFDWSGSDTGLLTIATINDEVFSFDPMTLQAGHYLIDLQVSEGELSTHNSMLLTVIDTVPATDDTFDCDGDGTVDSNTDCDGDGVLNLADGIRDLDNDGIPDFLDEFDDPDSDSNWLPNQTSNPNSTRYLMTERGLRIGLGPVAVRANRHSSLVNVEDIENHAGPGASLNAQDSLINIGGIYDFEITGLNRAGDTVRVVIPLTSGILNSAEYRKYTLAGGWQSFVVDGGNNVASAKQTLGLCPAPDSSEYVSGLNVFDRCIQLTLQDGGPNDADGEINGVIRDPSGAAVVELIPEKPVTEADDGSGGGLLHPWFLWFLFMGLIVRIYHSFVFHAK